MGQTCCCIDNTLLLLIGNCGTQVRDLVDGLQFIVSIWWGHMAYCICLIIIMDFIRTHVKQVHIKETEKGKYQHYKKMIHNRTETIYINLKTKYTYPNHSSQISLIIPEVWLSSSPDLDIMVHTSIPYSKYFPFHS